MLVIGPTADAAYYWEKGARARWLGRGLSGMGATEEPDVASLRRVLHGRSPGGEALWPSADRRRRLGYDLVFAVPKPLSLLFALGAPDVTDAIASAHNASVDDAFDYLERRAAWVRRGNDGTLVSTRGLSAAAFQHHLSRAGDPHLHTHVVVANAACDLGGAWSSLDSRWLFAERRAAGALYQAALRHHLDAAGLSLHWEVRPDGLGIVADVSDEIVSEFSRRRRQLVDDTGRRRGRIASVINRPPRPVADPESWKQRARALGFDPRRFRLRTGPPASTPQMIVDVEELLGAHGVTARRALFTRRDLVEALAARLPNGGSPAIIEARVDRILASEAVVRIIPVEGVTPAGPARPAGALSRPHLSPRYSTPELLALEDRLVADAGRGAVTVIRARPGPDAWATLDAARAEWRAAHRTRPVVALVTTAAEARDVEAATGIDTFLVGNGPPGGLPAVVVVPGAQRLGTRGIATILDRAAARGDVVVLIDGGRRPAALEGRELLSRLSALSPSTPSRAVVDPASVHLDRLDRLDRPGGSVTLCADSASRYQAAVEDWAAARRAGPARLEARHWSDVDDLNRRARALVSPSGPTVCAGGHEYCAGEPVVVRRTSRPLGLTRGRTGTVVNVDVYRQRLQIAFAGQARPVDLPARRLGPTILAHAYAVVTNPRHAATGPTYTVDSRQHPTAAGDDVHHSDVHHSDVHHYVVAREDGAAGRERASPDPLTRLARDAGPDALRLRAGSFAEMTATRLLLAERLRASVPPGGPDRERAQAALDDAHDERDAARHWVDARLPTASARLTQAEDAVGRHQHQLDRLDAWIARCHPELQELAGLDRALTWRAELLGRAAELLPDRALVATIGPPPAEPSQRRTWRRAAVELEAESDTVRRHVAQQLGPERLAPDRLVPSPSPHHPRHPRHSPARLEHQRASTIRLP